MSKKKKSGGMGSGIAISMCVGFVALRFEKKKEKISLVHSRRINKSKMQAKPSWRVKREDKKEFNPD